MAKTILGVDIGHDQLKLALVRGERVLKTASAPMPENLLRDGRVTSRESMAELIRATMKEYGIRAGRAAFVLPSETVFIKNITMPLMTVEQLEYNLPFEFNDYITGELKDYVFDYAVISNPEAQGAADAKAEDAAEAEPPETTMELMAVGTTREVLEDVQVIARKSGLRLAVTAPAVSAYIALLRARREELGVPSEEYAILDLGYKEIRMYMFKGDRHVATRVLEIGMSSLDGVMEEAFGVDMHLAHTYLMTNYENCHHREECMAAYENIAVELMRALNFYRFSNPSSTLSDMWFCGGGAVIQPLAMTIGEMLSIQLHSADELVLDGEMIEECNSFVQAIGIAMG
ncbi:MAG: pilus assembly protein PilM [Clostridia bacterium]|nr:pilus assembly protein PilM [Clostridia bacterium]